jgi:mRNA interferase MazF
MNRGEIYLATFPFGDMPGMKLRPVLLLTGTMGPSSEVLVAYISSVVPTHLLDSDIVLDPNAPAHRQTALKTVSVLRLHKLATIHATSIRRYLGRISEATQEEVNAKLSALLHLE